MNDHKAGDDLRKGGGSGGTCNAPVQHIDGNGVQNDIQYAAGDGADHHPPGTAIHPYKHSEAVGGGVEKCADQNYPEVGGRIGHHLIPGAKEPKQRFSKQIAQQDQHDIFQDQQYKTAVQDGFGFIAFSLAQTQGQKGGAACAHQHGKSINDADDGIAYGGGGNAQLPNEVAHKSFVYNVI